MEHNELLACGPPVFTLTLAKRQSMDPEERKWKTMMYFILPWHLYSQLIKGECGGVNNGK